MTKSLIPAPATVPRLVPSLVNDDQAVLARESTSHADAILRLTNQTAAAQAATATVQSQADATAAAVAAIPTAGRMLARQELTGSGTYVPTAGATTAIVRMCGAGGGGGGAGGGAGVAIGGGGCSGTTIELAVGTAGVPLTGGAFSCGAAGTGGAAGSNGSAGGDATLVIAGSTLTAKGGPGGTGMASSAGNAVADGGSPVGGSTAAAVTAQDAGDPGVLVTAPTNLAFGGAGGDSLLGAGGRARSGVGDGIAAQGHGGGGGGGIATAAGHLGGDGGTGLIIIEEHS